MDVSVLIAEMVSATAVRTPLGLYSTRRSGGAGRRWGGVGGEARRGANTGRGWVPGWAEGCVRRRGGGLIAPRVSAQCYGRAAFGRGGGGGRACCRGCRACARAVARGARRGAFRAGHTADHAGVTHHPGSRQRPRALTMCDTAPACTPASPRPPHPRFSPARLRPRASRAPTSFWRRTQCSVSGAFGCLGRGGQRGDARAQTCHALPAAQATHKSTQRCTDVGEFNKRRLAYVQQCGGKKLCPARWPPGQLNSQQGLLPAWTVHV